MQFFRRWQLTFLLLFASLTGVESISVIVPCHPAHFPLLEELLTAYATQSLIPNEVVISLSEYHKVAPASIAALEGEGWPFTLILLKHRNKYPAATNRRFAVGASHGDLLLFQDADDLPHPQRVEIVKYIFEHNPIQHLIHSFIPDGGEFTPYSTDAIPLTKTTSEILFSGIPKEGGGFIPIHHGNICLTRAVAQCGRWSHSHEVGEDFQFNMGAWMTFRERSFTTPLRLIHFRSSLSYFSNTPPELR